MARQASEEQAVGRAPKNRLLASTLIQLLDERKPFNGNEQRPDDVSLGTKYNLDPHVMQGLARYVNSPSAGEVIINRSEAREDEEIMLTKACQSLALCLGSYLIISRHRRFGCNSNNL